MYLQGLKIFCDVVRHHSFSRGASANGISQSAASQAILQIEKSMEVELLDRSKRPWVLTPEGKIFFEKAQEIVNRLLELEASVRRRRKTGYKVRVAAIYSVGLQDMSQYVEEFRARVPGADVELEYMHPDRVREKVLADEADLGLMAFAKSGQELVARGWREEPMVFVGLPGHRLADHKTVRPSDLDAERFVAFDRGLAIRRAVDGFLKHYQVDVKVIAEFDSIANIKQAVEDGVGVSILPGPTVRREVERGALAAVPFANAEILRPLCIIQRRKRKLNSAVLGFVQLLQECNGSGVPSSDKMVPARAARGLGVRRKGGAGRKARKGLTASRVH
jgi:DNA-binding transcriptional LysR family regulator